MKIEYLEEIQDTENDLIVLETKFFKDLLSTQESLDYEFEKVLSENLWDLYQN